MSWTPTDEQARELGRVMQREMGSFLAHDPAFPDYFWTNQARAVLVAVGPHIAASALRDAAAETKTVASSASASWGADGIVTSDVKFTEVPALPQGAPTLLRARADQIEQEG